MKKFYSLLVMLAFASIMTAQQWIENIPQDKLQNNEVTFYDIQKAFNDYWEPFHVEDGYYKLDGKRVKAPGWKQFKRWEWYWENRIDPKTGKFPETSAADEFAKYLQQNGGIKSPAGNWTSLGPSSSPGGYSGLGRINCVAFRPGDNNTIYVGAPAGGLWKSSDGGSSWTVLTDNNGVLGVSDVIVIPTAFQDILYIATGDKDTGSAWSLNGGQQNDNNSIGVLKSTDGGATWVATGLSWTASQKITISRLILDPNSANQTIYAATSQGVFKTTDGGNNWNLILGGNIIDMEMNPGNGNILYASSKDYWNQPGIYRTTNGGNSWTVAKSFLSTDYRVDLAVTGANSNYVYAIVANRGGGLTSIERSTNSGATFTSVYTGGGSGTYLLGYYCDGSGTSNTGQGGYDLCIAADPNNANTVFIGGVDTWKSNDGGASWSISNMWTSSSSFNSCGAPVVHADKHCLAFQNGTSTLFEGNDGGIYKTTDGGTTWTYLGSGLIISQLYRLGLSKTDPGEVIAGLQDNGTKNLSGGSWTDVMGGDGMECAIDYTTINTQYGTGTYGKLRRTTNHWNSSTNIASGLTGTADWNIPFTIDPNTHTTIYAGYQDVFKSTDQGNNWTKISNWGAGTLDAIVVAPSNSNIICAATENKLYRTTNGGGTWTDITGTLPVATNKITYVNVHNSDANTIWVTFGEYDANGVFESTDGGSSWTNISAGLPHLPVMTIVQNKLNTAQNELYVGTDVGVYVKVGAGNWQAFMNNLPNVLVTELEIYYDNTTLSNSKLRAATFGRGLWESDLWTSPVPVSWTGSVSTDWNTGGNWSGGFVPTYAYDVVIPNTAGTWPVKSGDLVIGRDCNNLLMSSGHTELTVTGDLTISSGKSFSVDASGDATIWVSGNWTDYGTFSPGLSRVEMTGTSDVGIYTTPGPQVSPIDDDFSTWPGNWNGDIGAGAGQFNQSSTGNAGGASPEVKFTYVNANPATRRIYHNPINTSGLSSMTLDFKYMVDDYSGTGYTISAQYSTDGASWTDVWSVSPTSSINATSVSINLTASEGIGAANYYIAFQITGNLYNINYWYIDDVHLYYNQPGLETFNSLSISKQNKEVQTHCNLNVQGDFIIKPNAYFTNIVGNTLSVSGNTVFRASSAGTASFVDNGSSIFNIDPIVESYISQDTWHMVSAPINNALSEVFTDLFLYRFDETDYTWHYITSKTEDMTEGHGFFAYSESSSTGNVTVNYDGVLNNGDLTVSGFSYTPSQPLNDRGWNMVGNPYPSAINWNSNWTRNNIDATAYIYDGANYLTWNGTSGTHPNGDIAPGQGFWIKVNASGASLTIPQSERKHSTQQFYKSGNQSNELFLTVEGNGYSDKMIVQFNPDASQGFDSEYDAWKIKGDARAPQLYALYEGAGLTVDVLPFAENTVIPLGLEVGANGTYTLKFNDFVLNNGDNVWLEDLQSGKIVEINPLSGYKFTANITDDVHRYNLHFGSPNIIDEDITEGLKIYSYEENVYISAGNISEGQISIYDISGKELYSKHIAGEKLYVIPLQRKGIYIVQFTNNKQAMAQKVTVY